MTCILFNKPYGAVSQFRPLAGHKSLAEFGFPKGVYPAGRLDHDSEGLLLLTSDGMLQHRLCNPKFAHPRVYWAQVERVPAPEVFEKLARGITLSDGPCRPARARLIADPGLPPRDPPVRFRKTVPTAWVEIELREGRNRQARRMLAAAGHPVLRLFRCKIGPLDAAGLEPGRWRPLAPEETARLRAFAGKEFL
ncbi:MAG: pseudouridine synthase [Elusimicrobiales bacterium]